VLAFVFCFLVGRVSPLLALCSAGFESFDCLLESWVRISALSLAGYSLSALLAVHGAWAYWLLMVAGSLLVSSADVSIVFI
jgi:hypothetical protein